MSKDIIEEQEENYKKTKRRGDKMLEVAGSIGMAMAPTTLMASLLGNGDLLQYIALVTGGTLLLSPAIYHGMKHITTKLDERTKRDIHQVAQMAIMFQEVDEKDRRIGSMTALFLNEILDKFEIDNPDYPHDQLMNINQFIYLINSNYYERIKNTNKDLSREKLVRELIEKISTYLNDNEREIFDEKDAERVLYYMTFIPETLKKKYLKNSKKQKLLLMVQQLTK